MEIRSLITKEQYEELLDLFKKNAKLEKEDYQETYYYDSLQDLRIQKNNFFSKIWMKLGKLHDEAREEIEIKAPKEDFEKLEKIFSSLGFEVRVKWFRKRKEFNWGDIKVCLDYTKGYGYIIELEKIAEESEKIEIAEMLKKKMSGLGINITPKEDFDKKYQDYKQNWKELIKDDNSM